jgi:arylsulfatase A-like enzyme
MGGPLATFVAAGPGIRTIHSQIPGVQAVDLAPTLTDLLGIPSPDETQGRVLGEILAG